MSRCVVTIAEPNASSSSRNCRPTPALEIGTAQLFVGDYRVGARSGRGSVIVATPVCPSGAVTATRFPGPHRYV